MELASCYAHVRTNVSKFSLCKKIRGKKISPTACIGEFGENFLLAKISMYTVYACVDIPNNVVTLFGCCYLHYAAGS